jgi:Leucine-rich repeat (LRR) protein
MKKIFILFSIFLLSLGLAFSSDMCDETGETFILAKDSPIFLSFENYKMKDGWTPVVLSVGELEFLLWLDASGRISERREIGVHPFETVCTTDPSTSTPSLEMGANKIYFEVYVQNPVRTRWRLSPLPSQEEKTGTVVKRILFQRGGIVFYLGEIQLQLHQVCWEFREISPGVFQVQLHGPMVSGHRELVVEKAKGIIYSTHGKNNRLTTEQSRTLYVNPNRPASGSIPPQERAALIALYNSTNGDNWNNKSGWKTPPLAADGFALPGTENTWHGIGCDPGNTTVQWISLFQNNLNGSLPPELGNLANLQDLILWSNQISGSIPPELGNLVNLEILCLSLNQLSSIIPPELGNLANLKEINFFGNQLSGSIPPELGNLANLQYLELNSNQLSGNIPPELGNLANLQYLELDSNQFTGTIPPEIGNLVYLYSLNISMNHLSGSIPRELGNLVNLWYLILSSNQLSGTIPSELGNMANLESLMLSSNQLSGTIPPELGNMARLWYLDLSSNQLSGTIPPELNISHLILSSNQLSGSIPPELGNLNYVDLSSNQLSGSIPPELGNMWYLDLSSNQLSGSIPPELGNVPFLWYLDLSSNHLSGNIPRELGNHVGGMWYLILSSNQLSGTIPPELGNISDLKCLNLSSNKLSGSIPSNLINLKDLYNENSDLRWNDLFTNDDILRAFLNSKQSGGNWESTQTIAPADVTATPSSLNSIDISWAPISYTADTGGYRVFYSTTTGGPYTYFGMTANKTASSLTVTGLNPFYTYYFVVKTRTNPQSYNRNTIDSKYSVEVSASILQPVISGAVTCGGKGLQDVTIINSEGRTTLTDSNGNYIMKVSYGWSGIVTPSMTGYIFSPPNKSYTNVTVNQTNQNYTAELQPITISGAVTSGGKGLQGVNITLSDGRATLTDSNGNYLVTVTYGWSGTVTPSMAGYIFSPPNKSFTDVRGNKTNQNFQGSLVKLLTLTSPNGGESWRLRTIQNITWTSWGLSGNVWLQLWKNNKKVDDIAVNIPITNSSYAWAVGICLMGTASKGSGYTVKICTKDGLYFDSSDAGFSIVR